MSWITFGTQTSPEPMSKLDSQFGNVAKWSDVDCSVAGTNDLTLTPTLTGYTVPAYSTLAKYSFIAINDSTGAVTVQIAALSALKAYKSDGVTQIGAGDILADRAYIVTFNAALNSAAGGWLLTAIGTTASSLPDPVTVAHGGTGLTTLTANNVILGNGASNVAFVAPSTSGNVLTSNGTTWASAAAAAGGGSDVWLATLTASSSASLTDTTHITSTYNIYKFIFENILPATNTAEFWAQLSTNGGSTYISSGYSSVSMSAIDTAASIVGLVGDDPNHYQTAQLQIVDTINGTVNTASYGASGEALLINPNSAVYKLWKADMSNTQSSTVVDRVCVGGYYNGATTAINAIKFFMNTGNIASGKIHIYGVKTS